MPRAFMILVLLFAGACLRVPADDSGTSSTMVSMG
jgi:hypothetical protein